ncbi:ABC transporter ATP-binding protein [Aestuariibius sp. 2305UL40-4]|uniref:ABC transporter ATP-binding protein n=1 Tax=Aestuariibius violaceus TaxID=3234132 RepID=UPI00345E1FF7
MTLRLDAAQGGYGGRPVLEGIDLALGAGEVVALCGPNGCGKSTALRALRGALPLTAGAAMLGDRKVTEIGAKALAREVAMLGQTPVPPEEIVVRDLVALGRYAHRRAFAPLAAADHEAIDRALHRTGAWSIADRPVADLSGGQLQRSWIAMTVAQDAPHLLLDEPTNHLDMGHALVVMDLIRRLAREDGRAVAVVLHDLNLAARHADRIVLMANGQVQADGAPREVLSEQRLALVYDTVCAVLDHPKGGPLIVPLGSQRTL